MFTNENRDLSPTPELKDVGPSADSLAGRTAASAAVAAQITRRDVEAVLDTGGKNAFAEALRNASHTDILLRVLAQYIYFNSVFAGGAATLAGALAARLDLFRDTAEPIDVMSERSTEVAADIFYSVVDEFDGHAKAPRATHRALAQAMLSASASFFRIAPNLLNQLALPNSTTLGATRQVLRGYGVNQSMDVGELFAAIGFHMGSEILADDEFRVLDTFLGTVHAELVAHLQRTTVVINGGAYPAYRWVRVHASVEAEHFNLALRGANRSLRYVVDQEPELLRARILSGVGAFAAVQAKFMSQLLEG